jgi:hypothetical protein
VETAQVAAGAVAGTTAARPRMTNERARMRFKGTSLRWVGSSDIAPDIEAGSDFYIWA